MAEQQKTKLVSLTDLDIGYPGNTLFEGLNLSLYSNELVCFMGPNGSGKSTLIRTIAGLHTPANGRLDYLFPGRASNELHHNLALVLTDKIHAPNMTVFELVTFGRYPYLGWDINLRARDTQIIEEAIAKVNITGLRDRKLEALSDGQLQMAMIARALAQDTPLIILDEPTAHLDLNNRVEIMKLLRHLTRVGGKTILISTHELDLALQMADLIWLSGYDRGMVTGIPEDLVLDGSFDRTFQFKGFDLKTGKVQHESYQQRSVQLEGGGYLYLWTKNALERNGYHVVTEPVPLSIRIIESAEGFRWSFNEDKLFTNLRDLLKQLSSSVH